MFTVRSWINFFMGAIVMALGILPILNKFKIGPAWFGFNVPISILAYVVAAAGLLLLWDAFEEIITAYSFGWITGLLGGIFVASGVLKVLSTMMKLPAFLQFTWISPIIYQIIFIIEGIFLLVAFFALAY